ncbi:MAG: hypothetical protein K8J09_08845 [Planctomycetes bacterium]|nr:hypothetical protein [Planctomycetota bacterium]
MRQPDPSGPVCRCCGSQLPALGGIDAATRARIANTARCVTKLEAVRMLQQTGRFDLADSKAIVFHISASPGTCHRCAEPVADHPECPHCSSLNLDW